jgi:hypothetical protein
MGSLKTNLKFYVILLISLLTIVLHLLPGMFFEFHRDELLYFTLGQHLHFGYATVPPFSAFIAYISTNLFGYSVLSARLFPALTSGILVYLTSLLTKELKGSFRAQLISAIGISGTTVLVMAYGLLTPICFDIFFWTLMLFFLVKFINTNSNKYLIFIGLTAGFAFLNKYSILFLIIAILLILPFTKHKRIFLNKYLYFSVLISILIALPNIIWQIVHDFPVFDHMKELNSTQLVNVNWITFCIEQLLYLLPFTFIVIPGIVYFLLTKKFREYRFIIAISAVVYTIFIILHGKGYYTAGLFPFFIIAGALFIENIITNRIAFNLVLFFLILLSCILLPLAIPILKPNQIITYYDELKKITHSDILRHDEDGNYRKLPQLFADMLGWTEVVEITDSAYNLVEDKNRCVIIASNYGLAGAINIIGKSYNLPEPLSFCVEYKYWIPKEFKTKIDEVVYVNSFDCTECSGFLDIKAYFEEMHEIGYIKNNLAIEFNTKIYLFKKPKKDFNIYWKNQI